MAENSPNLQYESVTLPSHGIPYTGTDESGEQYSALPEGTIEMRPILVEEESKYLSTGGQTNEKAKKLVQACSKFPKGFDIEDMLVTDLFYALIMLRVLSYGEAYQFKLKCDSCNQRVMAGINLVQDLDERTPEDAENLVRSKYGGYESFVFAPTYDVTLPKSGNRLTLRPLTLKDQRLIEQRTRKSKTQSGSDSFILMRAFSIVAIDGQDELRMAQKEDFVRNMVGLDSAFLSQFREDAETGINLDIFPECTNCGEEIEATMPFDAEFFRPTTF